MNKFEEFDKIKTPEDWKVINIEQKQANHFYITPQLGYIFLCLIICISSIGFVYAVRKDFRSWVHEQFGIEDIQEIPIPSLQEESTTKELKSTIKDIFMYTYYENDDGSEDIQEVSVFQNGEFVKKDIMNMKGSYESQDYVFDYVRYEDRILTFNEKGFVSYTLPLLKDNLMFFGSVNNNLCSIDLKTQKIIKITNDNDSVNFKISPNKKYITINKSDKYWTVYNTEAQTEKKLAVLAPYAHDNEYDFFQDKYIICYDEESKTCLIDLETNKITKLNEQCLYPNASTLTMEVKNHQTLIHDVYSKKSYKINYDLSQNSYYSIINNRYLVFAFFQDKKLIIIDFKNQIHKILDYAGTEENIDVYFMDNEKYLVVSNDVERYMISIENIFGE